MRIDAFLPQPLDLQPRAASPPFSPRRDVFTPSWSLASEEAPLSEAPAPALARTPSLSPRTLTDTPPGTPMPRQAHFAAQTQEEAAVQTAGVVEVQTDAPSPPSETTVASEESEDSVPGSESAMSDGQWLLDRSEGQHHELCVDWAVRRQLASAAMVRKADLNDTSSAAVRQGKALGRWRWSSLTALQCFISR